MGWRPAFSKYGGGGGGGGSGISSFTYVATGAEPPNGFPIALPDARPDVAYAAEMTLWPASTANVVQPFFLGVINVSTIEAGTSGQLVAGDKIIVTVSELA